MEFEKKYERDGDISLFIDYILNYGTEDPENHKLIDLGYINGKKCYKKTDTVDVNIPKILKDLSGIHNITIDATIEVSDNSVVCLRKAPDNVAHYFFFEEECICECLDKNKLISTFKTKGEIKHALAKPFTKLIWDSYLRQRLSRVKEELTHAQPENIEISENDILQ